MRRDRVGWSGARMPNGSDKRLYDYAALACSVTLFMSACSSSRTEDASNEVKVRDRDGAALQDAPSNDVTDPEQLSDASEPTNHVEPDAGTSAGADSGGSQLDAMPSDAMTDAGADGASLDASAIDAGPTDATVAAVDAQLVVDAGPVERGYALNFGTGNPSLFVAVTNVDALRAARSFTLEAWLRLGTPPATGLGCVFCLPYGHSQGDSIALWFAGGSLYWGVELLQGQAGEAVAPWTLPSETWHHVAAVRDDANNESRLYVDGVLAARGAKALPAISYDDHALLIGADLGNDVTTFGFSGWIDEVRLYNEVRSTGQIARDMRGLSPLGDQALIAYYPFQEGSGGITADLSPRSATGALGANDAGAPSWVSSEVTFAQ